MSMLVGLHSESFERKRYLHEKISLSPDGGKSIVNKYVLNGLLRVNNHSLYYVRTARSFFESSTSTKLLKVDIKTMHLAACNVT